MHPCGISLILLLFLNLENLIDRKNTNVLTTRACAYQLPQILVGNCLSTHLFLQGNVL